MADDAGQSLHAMLGLPADIDIERLRYAYERAVSAATNMHDWSRAGQLSAAFDRLPSATRHSAYSGRDRSAPRWEPANELPHNRRAARHARPRRRWGSRLFRVLSLAVVAGMVVLVAWHGRANIADKNSHTADDLRARVAAAPSEAPAAPAPAFNKPRKPMPAHGTFIWLESKHNADVLKENIRGGASGRLTISVPSGNKTWYVKLIELNPRRVEVLGAIIATGRTLAIDVPLDGRSTTYDLRYAAGTSWYGKNDAFGPSGVYAKADKSFSFEAGTGWEVRLTPQPGGNLRWSGLGYNNF